MEVSHDSHPHESLGARRRLEPHGVVVCAGGSRPADAADHRCHELDLPCRHARLRPAALAGLRIHQVDDDPAAHRGPPADWDQCQHQSGYFLPWHRGYLVAFEAIVRASIVKQGGPATWALPYWDYNEAANPKARTLPLALTAAKMPDGTDNPLATPFRYGDAG